MSENKHNWKDEKFKESLELIKKIFKELGEITKDFKLNYVKSYIGVRLKDKTKATNFISFAPLKKVSFKMSFYLEETEQRDKKIEKSNIKKDRYDGKRYHLEIKESDLNSDFKTIRTLAEKAKEQLFKKNYYK